MHAIDLNRQRQAVTVSKLMHNSRDIPQNWTFPIPVTCPSFAISVDGLKVTTAINGAKVYEKFGSTPDPWIVLQARQPYLAGFVRDLKIVGTPTIPDEIDMIDTAGWAGWRADIYGEAHSGNDDAPKKAPAKKGVSRPPSTNQGAPWQRKGMNWWVSSGILWGQSHAKVF